MPDSDNIKNIIPVEALGKNGNGAKAEEVSGAANVPVPSAPPQVQAPQETAGCDRIQISEEAHEEQGITNQNNNRLKGELAEIRQDLYEKRGIIPGADNMKTQQYNAMIQADAAQIAQSREPGFKIPDGPSGVSASVIGREKNPGTEIGGVYLSPLPEGGQKVSQAGGGLTTPEMAKAQYDVAGSLADGIQINPDAEGQVLQAFSDKGQGLSSIRALLGLK